MSRGHGYWVDPKVEAEDHPIVDDVQMNLKKPVSRKTAVVVVINVAVAGTVCYL